MKFLQLVQNSIIGVFRYNRKENYYKIKINFIWIFYKKTIRMQNLLKYSIN